MLTFFIGVLFGGFVAMTLMSCMLVIKDEENNENNNRRQ